MASPVIDSVFPGTLDLSPGQFVDVTVVAHDPDSASGSVDFPVADSQGNTTTASVVLVLNDPLTFGDAVVSSGLPVTVQKIAGDDTSATYRVTAA